MFRQGIYFNEVRSDIDAIAARFVVRNTLGQQKSFKIVIKKDECYLQERVGHSYNAQAKRIPDYLDLTRGSFKEVTAHLLDILKHTGSSWDWERFFTAAVFFEMGQGDRRGHRL